MYEILPYEELKELMNKHPEDFFLGSYGGWENVLPPMHTVAYAERICSFYDLVRCEEPAGVYRVPRSKIAGLRLQKMERIWKRYTPLQPAVAVVRWAIGETEVRFEDGKTLSVPRLPKGELKAFAEEVREMLQKQYPRIFIYAVDEDGRPPVILDTGSVDAVCTSLLTSDGALVAANIAVPTVQEARAVYAALVTRRRMTVKQGTVTRSVFSFGRKGFTSVQDLRPHGHHVIVLTAEHPLARNPAEQGDVPVFYVVGTRSTKSVDFVERLWERLQLGVPVPLPDAHRQEIIRAAYHWGVVSELQRYTDAPEYAPEYVGVKVVTDLDRWSKVLHDVLN